MNNENKFDWKLFLNDPPENEYEDVLIYDFETNMFSVDHYACSHNDYDEKTVYISLEKIRKTLPTK